LVTISLYTIIILVEKIDRKKIQQQLSGKVHEKITGGTLVLLGTLFLLQVIAAMATSLVNQNLITEIDLAVHVSDFIISPALIIGGILLWQRKEFGYLSGLALLFQASMLFIGLIAFLIIQPFLTSTPLLLGDLTVVSVMGLICFIPLTMFMQGTRSKKITHPNSTKKKKN
jgi:peptidoglycan/LPS O-acetylase OafA/YrhL